MKTKNERKLMHGDFTTSHGQVGQSILQQLKELTGGQFNMMMGVKKYMILDEKLGGLYISIPEGPKYNEKGINAIKIVLNGHDLYDVEFLRVWGRKTTVKAAEADVCFFDLINLLESETNMVATLYRRAS